MHYELHYELGVSIMFSWFLKLLGINEDRPATSNNSILNSSPAPAKQVEKPEPAPAPEPKAEIAPEPKPAAAPEPTQEKAKAAKSKAPKSKKQSLTDAYPDLKSNIIKKLSDAGFKTKAAITKADDDKLLAIKGIGKATLKILRK